MLFKYNQFDRHKIPKQKFKVLNSAECNKALRKRGDFMLLISDKALKSWLVLANYGLDNLRFLKPVTPETNIRVELTVKEKASRNEKYGEVRWQVLKEISI